MKELFDLVRNLAESYSKIQVTQQKISVEFKKNKFYIISC